MNRNEWNSSSDPAAMIRFAAERGISWQRLIQVGAACARHGLRYIPTEKQQPAATLDVVEQWADGQPLPQGLVETAYNAQKMMNVAGGHAAYGIAMVAEAVHHADQTTTEIRDLQAAIDQNQAKADAIESFGSWNPNVPNKAYIISYGVAGPMDRIRWLQKTYGARITDLCALACHKVATAAAWAADTSNTYTWLDQRAMEKEAADEANRAMADTIRSMIPAADLGY